MKPSRSLLEFIPRIAPRPVLLVAGGGQPAEIPTARMYRAAGGANVDLWLPGTATPPACASTPPRTNGASLVSTAPSRGSARRRPPCQSTGPATRVWLPSGRPSTSRAARAPRAAPRGRCRSRCPSRAASRRGPRSRCCRSRPAGPGSRRARRTRLEVSTPSSSAATRSPGPGRGCCGSGRSARRRQPLAAPREERAHLARVRHAGGVAEADLRAAGAASRAAMPTRARRGTWPSYGQPNDVAITPSQRRPPRARAQHPLEPGSDSSIERLTFLRLWVSEAERNTLTSSKRSRCSQRVARARARWGPAPRRRRRRARRSRRSTSAASASCGITSARTKLVTSSRRRPVRASLSISRILSRSR